MMTNWHACEEPYPTADGWRLVTQHHRDPMDHPMMQGEIEVVRPEWAAPQRLRWDEMHPLMNIAGMKWRKV